jgi:hypothetical protein
MTSVTGLGEIFPFRRNFLALGDFFSEKYCPIIWAEFFQENRLKFTLTISRHPN